jgi:hypothetical protein
MSDRAWRLIMLFVLGTTGALAACRKDAVERPASGEGGSQANPPPPPQSLAMGGAKSRMTFFVTSVGSGRGGNLGGLAGADAHCQALAMKEGAGDHTWRAYLSTSPNASKPAVNARDRIGTGPWYDAEAELVAANVEQLHGSGKGVSRETALTEKGDPVKGVGDPSVQHDILTGSRADGTAFPAGEGVTCGNWTMSGSGRAQVGHSDRQAGRGDPGTSWNSAHASRGCSPDALRPGAGLFYCFAID